MPHVIVHFNPEQIDQQKIDALKKKLAFVVAKALSSPATLSNGTSPNFLTPDVSPNDIYVGQHAAHPTDMNPAPVEIVVNTGKLQNRDTHKVRGFIAEAVRNNADLIPTHLLGEGNACVWVRTCEDDSFGFIRA